MKIALFLRNFLSIWSFARESRCDCDFVSLVRSGSIPDVLGSLLEMRSIDLSNNYMLSGLIPNAIWSCVKVTGMPWTVLPEDRETLTKKGKKGQKLVFAGAWGAIFGQIFGCFRTSLDILS